MSSLQPSSLTWTALLGRWIEFAKASVALPEHGASGCWRESVVSVITLQAVCFALAQLDELADDERAVAIDRAEILIRDHVERLESIWAAEQLHDELVALIADARRALRAASDERAAGVMELIWPGPGSMVMPQLDHGGAASVAVMAPGTIVMAGEPVAWWRMGTPLELAGCHARWSSRPRQVYRQLDADGRIVRDVIATIDDDVEAGMPLLVPLRVDGESIGHFTMDREAWEARQRSAMDGETIPIEVRSSDAPDHAR